MNGQFPRLAVPGLEERRDVLLKELRTMRNQIGEQRSLRIEKLAALGRVALEIERQTATSEAETVSGE